jgi:hypothetical protein
MFVMMELSVISSTSRAGSIARTLATSPTRRASEVINISDHPKFHGPSNELRWSQQPASGVAPSNEGLEANELTRRDVQDWLVLHGQLLFEADSSQVGI